MAYDDFLEEFARAQGVGSKAELLSDFSTRYAFQIKSRERAKSFIETLSERSKINFKGLRVLDIGCAYGSFGIELSKIGAHVVGIDISDKWLKLAEVNAQGEANIPFLKVNAASRAAVNQLREHGPFDLFIVNDVFEHIYDTVGLLDTINELGSDKAQVYFKVPNGLATRHVLMEGHKKKFGISLLPPDYWSEFVTAPFHIYYRRWAYFDSLFKSAGFKNIETFNKCHDDDIERTRRFIVNDVNKIRRHLIADNFENRKQLNFLKGVAREYYDEVADDLENMGWDDLFWKYRVTFWEGMLSR